MQIGKRPGGAGVPPGQNESERLFEEYLRSHGFLLKDTFVGKGYVDFKVERNNLTVLCEVKEVKNRKKYLQQKWLVAPQSQIREDVRNVRKKFGKTKPDSPVILVLMNFSSNSYTGFSIATGLLGDMEIVFNPTKRPIPFLTRFTKKDAALASGHNTRISAVFAFNVSGRGFHFIFHNPFAKHPLPINYFPHCQEVKLPPSLDQLSEKERQYLDTITFWPKSSDWPIIDFWQTIRPSWHKYVWRNPDINDPQFRFPLDLLASGLASLYGLGAKARRQLYRRGWLKTKRLPAPVISVGNITVGGTGKTPMVALLTRKLQQQGLKVAILSRGFGGRRTELTRVSDGESIFYKPPEVGEEAYWLAKTLPGVIVYTCPSRYAAGMAAWRKHRPDLFLLDDGFQHFQLHRDLDIVLLDDALPFGNGKLLPAGPLREPQETLKQAQVIILTRYTSPQRLLELVELYPDKTLMYAKLEPFCARRYTRRHSQRRTKGRQGIQTTLFEFRNEPDHESVDKLAQTPLFAFSGIARPQDFKTTLNNLGVELKGFMDFPDHYSYSEAELSKLIAKAKEAGADALVTTAKDWARLGEKWRGDLPLWVLEVELSLARADILLDRINQVLEPGRKGTGGMPAPPEINAFSDPAAIKQPLTPEVRQRLQSLKIKGRLPGDAAGVRNILVRAPNWVGDAVMALPVLSGLADLFPQAAITVLAAPRVAPLFEAQPQVAGTIIYPPGREKWRLLWRLRGRFDLGVALPNSLEAALGLWLAGAKARVGYNTDGRRPFLTLAVNGREKLKGLHTVYYLLGILRAFGEIAAFTPPRLHLSEAEVAEAQDLLNSFHREAYGPWVALSPGAAFGPAKRWPPERFAAVGRMLQEDWGARLALLGGPEDAAVAAEVKTLLRGECLNLTGRTSLRRALAVLSRMDLLITNDSGLMHAAAALETPLVAVFGSTDPHATRPFTERAAVIYHGLSCSPCLRRTCDLGYPCLTDISPDEVRQAARRWLG